MSSINRFEDLIVWQEARQLNIILFKILMDSKLYFMRDHLLKTSVSIVSNIAEGFERDSKKEYVRFPYIARGSCGELRSQLYLAMDFGMISEDETNQLIGHCKRISYLLYKLIKSLSS